MDEKKEEKEAQKKKQKDLSFQIWKRVNPSYSEFDASHFETESSSQYIDFSKMRDKEEKLHVRLKDKHSEYREAFEKYKKLHTGKRTISKFKK